MDKTADDIPQAYIQLGLTANGDLMMNLSLSFVDPNGIEIVKTTSAILPRSSLNAAFGSGVPSLEVQNIHAAHESLKFNTNDSLYELKRGQNKIKQSLDFMLGTIQNMSMEIRTLREQVEELQIRARENDEIYADISSDMVQF